MTSSSAPDIKVWGGLRRQYVFYFVAAYLELWLVLVPLGFSNGLAGPGPIFAIFGSIFFLAAAPLSVFMEKPAALIGVLANGAYLVWPILGGLSEGITLDGLAWMAFIIFFPAAVIADATRRLTRRSGERWLALRAGPNVVLRALMAALPIVAVMTTINVRVLGEFLFEFPIK